MTDKIVKEAQKRYRMALDFDEDQRRERVQDKKFVRIGDQWPEAIKRDRETPGAERPMLTINKLLQFSNQVTNEIRQNCPSIRVRPADDEADIKAANILNGRIRSIEQKSNARIAYETAAESAIDTGLGYFRIHTDYADSDSFDQDILISRIVDVNSVFYDINSVEPDGCDAKWCLVTEIVSKEGIEKQYPNIDAKSFEETLSEFIKEDSIIIADYYYIEEKQQTICLMQDGSTVIKDELPEEFHPLIVKERKSSKKVCKVAKLVGDQVADESELLCDYIPVIPVIGSETFIEGKRYLQGLTRQAKDAQRLYNYMETANAESLSLAPKAPYVAALGQTEGFELEWQNANRLNISVLHYNPIDVMGNVLPPPRREQPPQANPGFEMSMNRAAEDIKSVMGIYDASLGNKEGEQSGRAIISQMKQANTATYHYSANLERSIKQAGKIILQLLQSIDDTPKTIQTVAEDGTVSTAKIDPNAPQAVNETPNGNVYNYSKGKYDVTVDVGPTYATRRQEAFESQIQMAQADPTLMQIAGDIIIGNADWPGAEDIAKRKKAMLPPQIMAVIKSEEENSEQNIDPQVEIQMNQMADQVEQLSSALQEAMNKLDSKEEELEIKRFDAQTKRLELTHKMAMESTDLTHRMALDQANLELALQPNTGEAEDIDEEPEEEKQQEQQEPAAPHPDLMNAIKELKDTHAQTQAIIGAINKPKRIIRGPDGRPEGIE